MEVVNETPYVLHPLDATVIPSRPALTFVVKGTFKLVTEGPAEALAAGAQPPIGGDETYLDDIGRSYKYATDLVPLKLRGEVTVNALCHPPTPQAKLCDVAMSLGPIHKTLRVSGDRAWSDSTRTQPFDTLPVRWERAFGGMAFAQNPLGRGIEPWPTPAGPVHYLPNVEYPDERVSKQDDRPRPAGFGPVSPMWSPRLEKNGTRDQRWALFRAPLPPEDFDPAFYQAAPADQQLAPGEFFRGDERITLTNLHPHIAEFRGALPGTRLRCFAVWGTPYVRPEERTPERFEEVVLKLDTVHIDAEAETVTLVWRQPVAVSGPAHLQIVALYLAEEPLAQPAALPEAHRARFEERRMPIKPPPDVDAEIAKQTEEAKKVLRDGNVDPELIKELDGIKDPQKMFDRLLKYLDQKITETNQLTARIRGGGL